MPLGERSEATDFRSLLLALRGRSGLLQRELAAAVGVTGRTVQTWEAGANHPSAAGLRRLIEVFLRHGALAPGREEEQAAQLWDAATLCAPRLTAPFDPAWFAGVLARHAAPAGLGGPGPEPPGERGAELPGRRSWGEAPDVGAFHGRATERETLTRWILGDRVRLVAVVGTGGIGKTAFAVTVARDLAPRFAYVHWRSLRNAPPFGEWVPSVARFLSDQQQVTVPEDQDAQLDLLQALLGSRRALLVLDNVETVLEPGAEVARYRPGYEGYGALLRRIGAAPHRGCLLLTSREKPPELGGMEGEAAPVRSLRLGGLRPGEGQALLSDKRLTGDGAAWRALVGRYSGNPLALRVVGQSVAEIFGGDIGAFLSYAAEEDGAVFGGIRRLLDEQIRRLSPLERSLVYWLAVERESVGLDELADDVLDKRPRRQALTAIEGLRRRSLIEPGERGTTFTLQPVVLEYATDRLVEAVAREIAAGAPDVLASHALIKATAKEYVRRSQERLIAAPLLEALRTRLGGPGAAERLLSLLERWRGRSPEEQGYGPGNAVTLLRRLRGDLRGLDLSRLSIRQADLQTVEAQGATLAGSRLSQTVLAEPFDAIGAVAFDAPGTHLAASATGGEVRVWRVADRAPFLSLRGHTAAVYGVAFSVGGALATGSVDGTVRLWEVASGRPVATLEGHGAAVLAVAFSADGRLVASGGADGTVRLWEVASGRPLTTLEGHGAAVHGVAFSGGGVLASGGADGTVRLWDARRAAGVATLRGHTGGVAAVALSADGRLAASGGMDGTVRLWDARRAACLATLEGHAAAVLAVALSADGRLAASGGYDGTVRLWDGQTAACLATLEGHAAGVIGVALSPDGTLVASGSTDGTVRLWDARRAAGVATLRGHTAGVLAVALSADGRLAASGNRDRAVRVWEVGSGRPLAALRGHSAAVRAVAFSAEGLLTSGSMDGTVRLWDPQRAACLATLEGHTGGVVRLAFSADGALVSGSYDGTVRLWDPRRAAGVATLEGHTGEVLALALSADGVLASGSMDGTVRLWDPRSAACLATLRGHTAGVVGVAFAAGGVLVSGSLDGTVRLWDPRSAACLATLEGHAAGVVAVYCVALSVDGRLVASGGMDGTVRLWDARSAACLATLEGHAAGVVEVAFSAGGLLASCSYDGTVRLWDAGRTECVATLRGHGDGVLAVVFSVDGRLVASGGMDGTVRLWSSDSHQLLHTLRAERPYEGVDITGVSGVTEAQRAALLALGARRA
jgi:WD40 repeat protein/transcriptional regulator with XRE-family HTH domain